jgi:hypothetical protein
MIGKDGSGCHQGIAVGLLWASSIVRSSWLLVIVTVPQRVVYAQVHFMAVWLLDAELIRIVEVVCNVGVRKVV